MPSAPAVSLGDIVALQAVASAQQQAVKSAAAAAAAMAAAAAAAAAAAPPPLPAFGGKGWKKPAGAAGAAAGGGEGRGTRPSGGSPSASFATLQREEEARASARSPLLKPPTAQNAWGLGLR